MSRIPVLRPEELNEDQRKVYEDIQSGERGKIGIRGPFNPWLRSPKMADLAQRLGAFFRFNTSLEQRLSELAIIIAGRHCNSPYEFAAHTPIAIKGGLDPGIVDAIRLKKPPVFKKADERAVYRFSITLLETHDVDDATYNDLLEQVGEQGVVEVIGILGYYTMVSMTLNVFQVPLREGMTYPFED